mgnify:CR=1 FL=1
MKTRTWILIFTLILAVCLCASFSFLRPGRESIHAEITSQGKVIKTEESAKQLELEETGAGTPPTPGADKAETASTSAEIDLIISSALESTTSN